MKTRSTKTHSIEVAGQKVLVRSDAADSHVRRLADAVNARVRAIRESSPRAPIQNVLAVVAIQYADELADLEDRVAIESRNTAGQVRKLAAKLADGAAALDAWVREAEREQE